MFTHNSDIIVWRLFLYICVIDCKGNQYRLVNDLSGKYTTVSKKQTMMEWLDTIGALFCIILLLLLPQQYNHICLVLL